MLGVVLLLVLMNLVDSSRLTNHIEARADNLFVFSCMFFVPRELCAELDCENPQLAKVLQG